MRGIHFLVGIILGLSSLTLSCGGTPTEREAVGVAAIAGAATVISLARSQAQPQAPVGSPTECCAVCDACSFPCGDACLRNGMICLKPKGCACYENQLPDGESQRLPDPNLTCPQEMSPVAPVVPFIVY